MGAAASGARRRWRGPQGPLPGGGRAPAPAIDSRCPHPPETGRSAVPARISMGHRLCSTLPAKIPIARNRGGEPGRPPFPARQTAGESSVPPNGSAVGRPGLGQRRPHAVREIGTAFPSTMHGAGRTGDVSDDLGRPGERVRHRTGVAARREMAPGTPSRLPCLPTAAGRLRKKGDDPVLPRTRRSAWQARLTLTTPCENLMCEVRRRDAVEECRCQLEIGPPWQKSSN